MPRGGKRPGTGRPKQSALMTKGLFAVLCLLPSCGTGTVRNQGLRRSIRPVVALAGPALSRDRSLDHEGRRLD
jgi:hypothetical protein